MATDPVREQDLDQKISHLVAQVRTLRALVIIALVVGAALSGLFAQRVLMVPEQLEVRDAMSGSSAVLTPQSLTFRTSGNIPVVLSTASGLIIRDPSGNGANLDPTGKLFFLEENQIVWVGSATTLKRGDQALPSDL